MLTTPELIVIAIIIGLFGLIFATRLKIEIIALIVLLAVTLTGLVSPKNATPSFLHLSIRCLPRTRPK